MKVADRRSGARGETSPEEVRCVWDLGVYFPGGSGNSLCFQDTIDGWVFYVFVCSNKSQCVCVNPLFKLVRLAIYANNGREVSVRAISDGRRERRP